MRKMVKLIEIIIIIIDTIKNFLKKIFHTEMFNVPCIPDSIRMMLGKKIVNSIGRLNRTTAKERISRSSSSLVLSISASLQHSWNPRLCKFPSECNRRKYI